MCTRDLTIAALTFIAAATAAAQAPLPPLRELPAWKLEDGGQLTPLPVARVDQHGRAGLDGRRVSLTFSRPLPIRDVLFLLVRGTPFSIVPGAAVSGTFIGELRELTLREALEAVLFPGSLDYVVRGTVIRVFPRRPETRLFELDYPDVRRALQRTTGTATALTTTIEGDLLSEVTAGVNALLSASGRAHVDRKAGVVQVTDFAERLDRVGVYLEAVQLRATRQVYLRARVLDVSSADAAAPSIDWRALARQPGSGVGDGTRPVVTDADALMRTLAARGPVTVVAAPELLALNNEPAVIRIADSARQAGHELMLSVTSQIAADGRILMSIAPSWSRQGAPLDPLATSRGEADTMVRVQEGQTVVVSGLLHECGAAARCELVVLLTPTLVGAAAATSGGTR